MQARHGRVQINGSPCLGCKRCSTASSSAAAPPACQMLHAAGRGAHHSPALHSAASRLPSTQAWLSSASRSCCLAVQEKRISSCRHRCATSARARTSGEQGTSEVPAQQLTQARRQLPGADCPAIPALPLAAHGLQSAAGAPENSTRPNAAPGYLSSSFFVFAPTQSLRPCTACQRSAAAVLAARL